MVPLNPLLIAQEERGGAPSGHTNSGNNGPSFFLLSILCEWRYFTGITSSNLSRFGNKNEGREGEGMRALTLMA